MIKFIKEFLLLNEEDKLYKMPWEFIKWIWAEPTAYKFKGDLRISDVQPRKSWWNRKRTVNQSK